MLAVFDVTSLADSGPGSLRDAVVAANASAGPDTIDVLVTGEIELTSGELFVTDSLTINGPGVELSEVKATSLSRLVNFQSPNGSEATGDLSLSGITLSGGVTTGSNTLVGGTVETTHSGGGIRFFSTGQLTLTDSVLRGNHTTGDRASGGSVFTANGTVVLNGSTIERSSTSGLEASGGGIYTAAGSIRIENSTLFNNHTSGADSYGGGIAADSGSVIASGGTFLENTTTDGAGGAIATLVGDVVLSQSTLLRNAAAGDGGAVSSTGGSVEVSNTTLQRNIAGISGGAIDVDSGSLRLTHAIVTNNQSSSEGGGVAIREGDLTIVASAINGNESRNGWGGGISVSSQGSLSLERSDVSRNLARFLGGGGIAFVAEGAVTIRDSTITENESNTFGNSNGGGGVLVLNRDATLTVADSIISGNLATGDGAIGITLSAVGGGISFEGDALTLVRTRVTGNSTLGMRSDGGGVFTDAEVSHFEDSEVSGNRTRFDESAGGGIASDSGLLRLVNTSVTANSTLEVDSPGGGLFVQSGVAEVINSTVSGNSTSGGLSPGGGIDLFGSELYLSNSTVSGNRATGTNSDGGGIAMRTRPSFGGSGTRVVSSTIVQNLTAEDGGGIWSQSTGAALSISGTIVAGNLRNTSEPNDLDTQGPLTVQNSLVGINTSVNLIGGTPNEDGNFVGTIPDGAVDPLLGPLADNGGPTPTHALLPGSPAIDAINAPAPLLDYQLDDTFAEQQGVGSDLASFGGQLSGGVYTFASNEGLEALVPAINEADYAIQLSFQLDELTGDQRLIDLNAPGFPDAGLYVSGDRLRYIIETSNPANGFTRGPALEVGVRYQLVVARSSGVDAEFRVFLDGEVIGDLPPAFSLTFGDGSTGVHELGVLPQADSSRVVRMFRSTNGFGEPGGGAVDFVRIYDRALDDSEVASASVGAPGVDQRGLGRTAGVGVDIGAYEAQGAVTRVPGDYNGDNTVDAADYTVWRDALGANVSTLTNADGDGDGEVTQVDYQVWRSHFGLQFTTPPATVAAPAAVVTAPPPLTQPGFVEAEPLDAAFALLAPRPDGATLNEAVADEAPTTASDNRLLLYALTQADEPIEQEPVAGLLNEADIESEEEEALVVAIGAFK